MLKIIPLGGLGEIGLNMMVFEYKDTIILIDTGLMFPEDYMLGIDIVIPDIVYLKQTKATVSGIILTHAHEDHIGALPYLLREINAPVFGTAFTLGIVKHKLEEHGLIDTATLHEIGPKDKLNIGPFKINFLRVGHSVVDGVGLAIRTPVGLIVHTGDFKISYDSSGGMITDVSGFAQYGDKGVLALLSDSTNVEKEGHTISGKQVGESLRNILSKSSGRIIVALFASNVARIQKIVDIAKERDCKIVFNGRSVELTVQIAKKLNYLNVMDNMEITVDRINDFPDDRIIIVTTGSQGEPMSALARIAAGTHKQIKIKDNDTVILSSKFIPGNEKAIAHIINNLYRRGADVIYEKISDIHVSGHAFREELKLMINLTKPKYFIPIHGEYRHLVLHSRLAQSMGIKKERVLLAEDGQIIEFDKNGGKIGASVETGRVLVDGKGVGDVGRSVLKERRNLSEDGIVVVAMTIHEETGALAHGPEIISKGFVFFSEAGHILDDAQSVVLDIVQEVGIDEHDRIEVIKSRIQTALRKYFNFTIKRRPIILPVIIKV
jgi:ribonuclease J